jgi:phosphomannomutase
MEEAFPCSGEINRQVQNGAQIFAVLQEKYSNGSLDTLDGLSIAFSDWRFNLRASNTEPVIRLNVETRGDRELLKEKTEELLQLIGGNPA